MRSATQKVVEDRLRRSRWRTDSTRVKRSRCLQGKQFCVVSTSGVLQFRSDFLVIFEIQKTYEFFGIILEVYFFRSDHILLYIVGGEPLTVRNSDHV